MLTAAAPPGSGVFPSLSPALAAELLRRAAGHGVLPQCVARLRAAGHVIDVAADRALLADAALALALAAEGDRLVAALAAAGIETKVAKGAAFARALYPGELRGFTDIDLLLRPEDFGAAGAVLRARGYGPVPFRLKHATGYGEEKWQRAPTDPLGPLLVELHWDMIGSPTLRRGRRCDLALLRTAAVPEERAQHLLVAAVHGALGDGFTRLQPLADLARALEGPLDLGWLGERMRAGRLEKPVALALHLASRCFGQEVAATVLRELGLRRPPAWLRALLTPALIAAHGDGSGLRRQMVREWLKLAR